MDKQSIILIITCILNMSGAIAIWLAKVWWTNEFAEAKKAQVDAIREQTEAIRAAKDETIKSKEAHIEGLKAAVQRTKDLKDAQIESLKNEIQNLRELTPMKVQEYFN